MILAWLGLAQAAPRVSIDATAEAGVYRYAQDPGAQTGPLYPRRISFGWTDDASGTRGLGVHARGWLAPRLGVDARVSSGRYGIYVGDDQDTPRYQSLTIVRGGLLLGRSTQVGRWTVAPAVQLGAGASNVTIYGTDDAHPEGREVWTVGPAVGGELTVGWGRVSLRAESALTCVALAPSGVEAGLGLDVQIWQGLTAVARGSWMGRQYALESGGAAAGALSDQLTLSSLGIGYKF